MGRRPRSPRGPRALLLTGRKWAEPALRLLSAGLQGAPQPRSGRAVLPVACGSGARITVDRR